MDAERWEAIGNAWLDDWNGQNDGELSLNEMSAFSYAWDIAWSTLTHMEEDDELRWTD